jgi:hypothetical protein
MLLFSLFLSTIFYSGVAVNPDIIRLMATLDTGGAVDFRKDVLSFSSTKDDRYSPLEEGNSLFSWHISPLFDFATSITLGAYRPLVCHSDKK